MYRTIGTGTKSADGVIGEPNGNLLLIESQAHRLSRTTPDGKIKENGKEKESGWVRSKWRHATQELENQ